jgi:hypothetical protein
MRRFHLWFGAAVVVAFLLTGQYMDRFHGHLEGLADGPRMLYRSRHIYILLAGLLHLGLGAYLARRRRGWARGAQLAGTALVAAATCLLVVAFFCEPPDGDLENVPYSRLGLYLIAGGTLAHVVSGVRRGKDEQSA